MKSFKRKTRTWSNLAPNLTFVPSIEIILSPGKSGLSILVFIAEIENGSCGHLPLPETVKGTLPFPSRIIRKEWRSLGFELAEKTCCAARHEVERCLKILKII